MACATQVFPNVSTTAWACLQAKITAAGYPVTGDTGSASGNGITIAWQYDATNQTLSITCTSAPFFYPCGEINAKIHQLIDSSGCLN